MEPNEKPVLDIEGLCTTFRTPDGTARAVDGVGFRIARGETFALVGESGCGKSVTALSIMRLLAPAARIESGAIRIEGRDVIGLPAAQMRTIRGNRVGMVFQEPMTALNPVLAVGPQVAETLRLHRSMSRAEARIAAIEMLARVGLPDPARRYGDYPHEFSGGMRQRAMLAMALVCRPALLIADEPTTALDVTIQAQILDLIRDLKREFGMSVLLITHDMGIVAGNADRVGVMYSGRIVEQARGAELFRNPSHPYAQLLLESLPSRGVRGRLLATIAGTVPPPTRIPTGCRFHTRCPAVMDRCRTEIPLLHSVNEDHTAECHLLTDHSTTAGGITIVQPEPAPYTEVRPGTPRLEVRGLKMHFRVRQSAAKGGEVRAVDGVDLHVAKGETLALVGESGCGKTTVANCIVRLLDPTNGSVRLDGEEVTGLRGRRLRPFRSRMQLIFQDPFASLNPRITVGDALLETLSVHRRDAGRTARHGLMHELLKRVGLDPAVAGRYAHECSGGQRQRVVLARALAVEAHLLVCDEATSSLDISIQAQILNLLRRLQSELGLSYLFITHDLGVVKYLADRVAVMYLGRIVEEGPTARILDTPIHPYTQALLAAVPLASEGTNTRVVLHGEPPSPSDPPHGCHFHPRCPFATDACRILEPALESPREGSNRRVACMRHREIHGG